MAHPPFMSSVRQASRSPAKVEGFVVANLDGDVLAGTPFMEANDITVPLTATSAPHPAAVSSEARRAILLRSPPTSTIWPGEFVEVKLPANAPPDSAYALEPCTDAPSVKRLTASQLMALSWHSLERGRKDTYPQPLPGATLPQAK